MRPELRNESRKLCLVGVAVAVEVRGAEREGLVHLYYLRFGILLPWAFLCLKKGSPRIVTFNKPRAGFFCCAKSGDL